MPLPWTTGGEYFGFSEGGSHLPQPEWFGSYSVEAETADPGSTLELYREAFKVRARLQTAEELEWLELDDDVIAFRRPNGWTSVTNFGANPIELPGGEVILRTDALADGAPIASESTVWLLAQALE